MKPIEQDLTDLSYEISNKRWRQVKNRIEENKNKTKDILDDKE
jgi:hypothetical protein